MSSRAKAATFIVLALACCACFGRALADHCPEESVSTVPPDTVLAGIDLNNAKIEDLVRRFGAPTSSHDDPCDKCPPTSGESEHVWKLRHATVIARSMFYRDALGKRVESVYCLKLQGKSKDPALHTGKGAGLWDTAETVKALYGNTYRTEPVNTRRFADDMLTYCFSDESELNFGFENGHVTSILLLVSIE